MRKRDGNRVSRNIGPMFAAHGSAAGGDRFATRRRLAGIIPDGVQTLSVRGEEEARELREEP